jgi:uncharacterized protein (DUF4415 family)
MRRAFYTVIWTWRGEAIRLMRQGGHGIKKNKDAVRYTAREIEATREQGMDRTDTARLDAMTDADLIGDDEDAFDLSAAKVGFPSSKQQLTLRLDTDVVDWFKSQGRGYQTRMNAVLRSFVKAQRDPHQ